MFQGLDVEAYDRSYSDTELIRRISGYFGNRRRQVAIIAGAVTALALVELSEPFIISQGVTALTNGSSVLVLAILVGLVFVVAISRWTTNLIRRRAAGRVVGDMVRDLRNDAFQSAMSRDMSFYDEFASGKIVSRITSDTQDFAQMIVLVTDLISQVVTIAILLTILFTIEWHLTLILCVTAPTIMATALAFRRIARSASRKASRVLANVNNNIQESIAGVTVAKNFRQEQALYQQFSTVNAQSYKVNWQRGFVLVWVFPTLNTLTGVGTAVLLYFGAISTLNATITLGAWLLFIRSLQNIWDPMTGIASFWSQLQAGLAASERVFALIDAQSVVKQIGNQSVTALAGDITFSDLRFQYSDQEIVLPNMNLHIRPGETVAFVGHTGAGKSSIAKLIARFYEYQGGQLLIDGQDIRTLDLSQYRRHLGIVSQVPFLFAGTVLNNIRYGNPAATDAEIEAVARQIGAGEWIETLPQGLQTEVGERGTRLSMGQRQLVVLTRVLVQKPSIFILDEATASIDPFTESQIQEALNLILSHSTSILIAHRLSTVKAADRIIVLKKGEVIEEGNHNGLMQQGGHYADLYNTYFRHQSLEYIEAPNRTLTA